jgi:hypothetical protein
MIKEKREVFVEANKPSTFAETFLPDDSFDLKIGSSCGCTTILQNSFKTTKDVPITFEFTVLKSQDYTGAIRYYKLDGTQQQLLGSTSLVIKIK